MWMMPLHMHVNQKSDYDDDELACYLQPVSLYNFIFYSCGSKIQPNYTKLPQNGSNNELTTIGWTAAPATGGRGLKHRILSTR